MRNKKNCFITLIMSIILVFTMIPASPVSADSNRDYWKKFSNHYYYDRLTDSKYIEFYNRLDSKCLDLLSGDDVSTRVDISDIDISKTDLKNVLQIFIAENPQYYFLNHAYTYTYDRKTGNLKYFDEYYYPEFKDTATRNAMTAKVRSTIDQWAAEIRSSANSDLACNLEITAHDYVLNKAVYD